MANQQQTPKCIVLWTYPRTISTVWPLAFQQNPNIGLVKNEPMRTPWMSGPQRQWINQQDTQITRGVDDTFDQAWVKATCPTKDKPVVFVKEMCKYLYPSEEVSTDETGKPVHEHDHSFKPAKDGHTLVSERLLVDQRDWKNKVKFEYIHCFLIRAPEYSVNSLAKLMANDKYQKILTPAHIGLDKTVTLFNYFRKLHIQGKLRHAPFVVEAESLVQNPAAVLATFCQNIRVPYAPTMLKWDWAKMSNEDKLEYSHDKLTPHFWHKAAIDSNGLKPITLKMPQLSSQLQAVVDQMRNDYNWLRVHDYARTQGLALSQPVSVRKAVRQRFVAPIQAALVARDLRKY